MTGDQIREAIDDIGARAQLLELAPALGLAATRRGFSCPACGADRRHPKRGDRRGAAGVTPSGTGWRCFECDASGDALSLISYVVGGAPFKKLARDDQRRVLTWAGDRGYCQRLEGPPVELPPRPTPAPAAPPARPPRGEVRQLWASCPAAEDDPEVAAYLRGRAIDPGDVTDRDLARALPLTGNLPTWARRQGVEWRESGYRLVVPVFNSQGELVSVRARAIRPIGDSEPKSLPPSGFGLAGMVMADPQGREMLRGAAVWSAPPAPPPAVLVVEGEPDFLTVATHYSDADLEAPAVLGVVAGSWSAELAAKVPDGATVVIWTHADKPGEKYAADVGGSLVARCTVKRGRFPEVDRAS